MPPPTPTPPAPTWEDVQASVGGGVGGAGDDSAFGRRLFDPNTGEYLGMVVPAAGIDPETGQRPEGRFIFMPAPGTGQNPMPWSPQMAGTYATGTGELIEVDSWGNVRESYRPPQPSAGGGGGRTLAEDLAFLEAQQGFSKEEREAQQEFTMQLNLFNTANQLARERMGLGLQARTTAIGEMGRDPFRAAIQAQGGIPTGASPHRRLREELMAFGEADIPTVGPEATIPELQGTIEQLTAAGGQLPTRPIGLARGGIIEMEREGGGRFTMRNTGTGQEGDAILVGESGTPEVVEMLSNGRLRVIPLAGRAQEGGDFEPTQLGGEAGLRADVLSPLWRALGMTDVPIARRGPEAYGGLMQAPAYGAMTGAGEAPGFPQLGPGRAAETFGALGVRPRLFFEPELGTFLLGRPGGELQVLGPAERAEQFMGPEGIASAVVMGMGEIKEMGFQPSAERPFRQETALGERAGRWAPREPIFSPFTEEGDLGVYLPDPRMIARVWNTLGPDTQRAVVSAYGTAGTAEGELMSRMGFHTPRGTAFAGTTARLA